MRSTDRILPASIILYLLTSMISISASQIVLGLAFVAWIVLLANKHEAPRFPGFFWPLLAYAGLSLIASALSRNPMVSFQDSRELLLLLIVPIVYTGIRENRDGKHAARALLASALASIAFSFVYALFKAEPGERISGFMDHYMTQAGLLLLFGALALSFFLFDKGKTRLIWGGGFALAALALVMTLTRNAWVGLVVVTCILLLLYKPKVLILLPVAAGLVFLASPPHVKRRALSIFDPQSISNAPRIEYLEAGIEIIRDFPLHGTGPNTVHVVFQQPKYELSAEARDNVHLHNNLIQIGAERGIPTLLAWLTFVGWAFVTLLRLIRERADTLLYIYAAAGLAACAGLFTAGFFEYNWGDSEVVTLFLCLITIPLGLEQGLKTKDTDA
ncbi:O-antigen ligase family protein [Acidobacteriota bacterium]